MEYIESTGAQCINTEYNPKYNTRVVVDVSNMANATGMIFGAQTSSSARFNAYRTDASRIRSDYFSSSTNKDLADSTPRTTVDKNANVQTAWDVEITNTAVTSGQCNHPLFLFCFNNAGTPSVFCSMRLYSCQIYDGDVLVRDYWPCYDPEGIACLYDKVEGKYYYNQGSGEFVAGGAVLPSGEIAVNITGTGDIDAAVKINGTWYDTATSGLTVKAGEIIVLYVQGGSNRYGMATIDGTRVLSVGDAEATYDWVVPSGISQINIALTSYWVNGGNSTITVTTS